MLLGQRRCYAAFWISLMFLCHFSRQDEEGEEDAEVQEVAAAAARAEAAAGPTRKSARTEHIDFKAREEER